MFVKRKNPSTLFLHSCIQQHSSRTSKNHDDIEETRTPTTRGRSLRGFAYYPRRLTCGSRQYICIPQLRTAAHTHTYTYTSIHSSKEKAVSLSLSYIYRKIKEIAIYMPSSKLWWNSQSQFFLCFFLWKLHTIYSSSASIHQKAVSIPDYCVLYTRNLVKIAGKFYATTRKTQESRIKLHFRRIPYIHI